MLGKRDPIRVPTFLILVCSVVCFVCATEHTADSMNETEYTTAAFDSLKINATKSQLQNFISSKNDSSLGLLRSVGNVGRRITADQAKKLGKIAAREFAISTTESDDEGRENKERGVSTLPLNYNNAKAKTPSSGQQEEYSMNAQRLPTKLVNNKIASPPNKRLRRKRINKLSKIGCKFVGKRCEEKSKSTDAKRVTARIVNSEEHHVLVISRIRKSVDNLENIPNLNNASVVSGDDVTTYLKNTLPNQESTAYDFLSHDVSTPSNGFESTDKFESAETTKAGQPPDDPSKTPTANNTNSFSMKLYSPGDGSEQDVIRDTGDPETLVRTQRAAADEFKTASPAENDNISSATSTTRNVTELLNPELKSLDSTTADWNDSSTAKKSAGTGDSVTSINGAQLQLKNGSVGVAEIVSASPNSMRAFNESQEGDYDSENGAEKEFGSDNATYYSQTVATPAAIFTQSLFAQITNFMVKINQSGIGVFSLITNGISLVIFALLYMKKERILAVFIGISVVDTFSLTEQFDTACHLAFGSSLLDYGAGCRIFSWIMYTSQMCSSCFVLMYTLERYVCVRWPMRVKVLFSKRNIFRGMSAIVLLAALCQLYAVFGYQGIFCNSPIKSSSVIEASLVFGLGVIVGQLIPYTAVAALNAMTITLIVKERIERAKLSASTTQGAGGGKAASKKSKTGMLIAASTFSIVVSFPKIIALILNFTNVTNSLAFFFFKTWAVDIVGPWNYCGSFIFYILAGDKFRQQLLRVITFGKLGEVAMGSTTSGQSVKREMQKEAKPKAAAKNATKEHAGNGNADNAEPIASVMPGTPSTVQTPDETPSSPLPMEMGPD